MPIECSIDPHKRRVSVSVVGDFTFHEVVDAIACVTDSPEFEPGFDILADHTRIGRALEVTEAKDFVSLLRNLSERLRGGRWATVTERTDSYGMMRMISSLAVNIPLEIQVFRSADEAEAWLRSPHVSS